MRWREVDPARRKDSLENDVLPDARAVQGTGILERIRIANEQGLEQRLRRTAVRVTRSRVDVGEQGGTSVKRDELPELRVCLLLFFAACRPLISM